MSLSRFIYIILHPIFIPLIGVYICVKIAPEIFIIIDNLLPVLYLNVFFYTVFFPTITVVLLLKLGVISSLEMTDYKERFLPLCINFICVFFCFLSFKKLVFLNSFLSLFFLGIILTLFMALIISRFWKISLHMLGVGGLLGMMINLNLLTNKGYYMVPACLFICGIVAFARLKEGAHTSMQIYLGFLVGFVSQLSMYRFILW
tara:strand:+ start:26 stop:634 length:609 start_codon:yes stop_codon:yes gene_type:complete